MHLQNPLLRLSALSSWLSGMSNPSAGPDAAVEGPFGGPVEEADGAEELLLFGTETYVQFHCL